MRWALFGWLLVLIYVLYGLSVLPSTKPYVIARFFDFVQLLLTLALHTSLFIQPYPCTPTKGPLQVETNSHLCITEYYRSPAFICATIRTSKCSVHKDIYILLLITSLHYVLNHAQKFFQ